MQCPREASFRALLLPSLKSEFGLWSIIPLPITILPPIMVILMFTVSEPVYFLSNAVPFGCE